MCLAKAMNTGKVIRRFTKGVGGAGGEIGSCECRKRKTSGKDAES